MSFYQKFIQNGSKGYSLRGGPFAKWRYPANKVIYRKRLIAGPEPERPRSVWSNWNYDSEIFAFSKRLNENFKENLLRQAFIDPSYAVSERSKLQDLELEFEISQNNAVLSKEGETICKNYIRALLNFWYPKLPIQGVEAIVEFLTDLELMANISKNLGIIDLIKTREFPVQKETLKSALFAIIAALSQSESPIRAHLFINDFIVTQLVGQDINEIWNIENPMSLLCDELKKNGSKVLPKARLIWSTGATTPTSTFIVGLYLNEIFLSKGSGETVEIAEEMAARDGLRKMFGTAEDSAPIPYGDKARKFSQMINSIYEKFKISNI